jgi:hypothetical protein
MMTPGQGELFLKTLHNPRYTDPDHTGAILLDGIFHGQPLSFFASPMDGMEYGRLVYAKAIEGVYGPIGEYEPPEQPDPTEVAASEVT